MTQELKAKAYDMALEAARKELGCDRKEYKVVEQVLKSIFPELAESEDERIIEEIKFTVMQMPSERQDTKDRCLAWLEKQKEQKPNIELIQRSWYMEGYHDREFGKEPKWILKTGESGPKHELNPRYGQSLAEQQPTEQQMHDLNEAIKGLRMDGCERIADSLHSLYIFLKSAYHQPTQEQKPISTEDMPYVTDEHFFEREQADSFKYRLAEYMTKNCKKEESPYGYTYKISSESILEMAKEELIKRGELQKPVEWSEKDEKIKERLITRLNWITYNTRSDGTSPNITFFDEIAWLKSLRPQWRPTEEQMEALQRAIDACESEWAYQDDELRSLLNDLQKL